MKRIGLFFLAAMLLLAGCRKEDTAVTLAEGEVAVYYTNASANRLVSEVYTPTATEWEGQVKELYSRMQAGGYEDTIPAIPSDLVLSEVKLSGNTLSMYLTGSYEALSAVSRILFLTAVTRTMTQLPDIVGILYYVNGVAATDGDGNMLGILRADSFVDNAVDSPEDYREEKLVLYFANEQMDRLVKTTRTVVYRSSSSLERIVVEQLLRGPEDKSTYATLPSTASLLSINVRDKVCYVNFDNKFITEVLAAYDYIPVYSVVNSLTELPSVEKVQISINGSSETAFQRDITTFSLPFERNLDYVEGES